MNRFEPKSSLPLSKKDEGWLVQIYGAQRRLLCVLDPSHGWMFLMGCAAGLLFAVLFVNLDRQSASPPAPATVKSPPLQVD
ncbi:MAG: hypothetical protein GC158_06335 [Cyanobacteria bacterium RI_101]|nr:hypothetical protein [Cyanobacteria bacterium RI_101]